MRKMLADCEQYLKDGETPAQRIERERRDTDAVLTLLIREKQKTEPLQKALTALLAKPYGCPFCDSGKLRNPTKDHDEDCGYRMAAAALGHNVI